MRNFKTAEEKRAYLNGARDMMTAIQNMDPSDYSRALSWKNDTSILAILCDGEKRQVEYKRQKIATLLDCLRYDKTEARQFIDSQQEDAVLNLYRYNPSKEDQAVMTIRRDEFIAVGELIKRDIAIGDPERLEKYFVAVSSDSSEDSPYDGHYCTIRDALASLHCEHRLGASMYISTVSTEQIVAFNLLTLAYEDDVKFQNTMLDDSCKQCVKQLLDMNANDGLWSYFDDGFLSAYRNKNGEPLKGAVQEAKDKDWVIIPGEYASLPSKRRFVRYVLIPRAQEILSKVAN